ncbi:hypothetical protein [Haloparvum sedimenti]|uniref:hypothetical protein n=1 Tax=Haloparvum sedimenti TaxID=1678448 RepID=UPI00071E9554|nr:hypothetical protein [Haloparvum sedimenti]
MSSPLLLALFVGGFVSGFALGYLRRDAQYTRSRVAETPENDPRGPDLGREGGYGVTRPSAEDSPDVRVEHSHVGNAEED